MLVIFVCPCRCSFNMVTRLHIVQDMVNTYLVWSSRSSLMEKFSFEEVMK